MTDVAAILQRLDGAAQILMAPPHLTSQQQLAEAQQIFLDFQKTSQPFDVCRSILESTNNAYVKFQAATCLKNGVIRDWAYLKNDRSQQLLNYLFGYVTNRENLEPFVREQLLLVCAIVLKRIGIDETGGDARELTRNQFSRPSQAYDCDNPNSIVSSTIQSLLDLIKSAATAGDNPSQHQALHKRFASASFIFAILNEYSSSTRASDFGMPWLKHLCAKKHFENAHLKNIFKATLEALNLMLTGPDSNRLIAKEPEPLNLLLKLLHILETIFTWSFDIITILSSQYAKHVDSIETPLFQPNVDWRDTIVNANTIQFIFFLYNSVRQLGQETLVHHALQCLSQLSSLTGAVLGNGNVRLSFVEQLISGAIGVMSNELMGYEVTPVSSMLYRICLHLQNRDTIQRVEKPVTHKFVELLSVLTCNLFVNGLKAETSDDDSYDRFKQAIDNICDAWMVLLQAIEKYERQDSPDDSLTGQMLLQSANKEELIDSTLMNNCTRQIFESYLRCHLYRPEGLREAQSVDDEEEIQEYEETDDVTYVDQLNAIGALGRVDVKHCIQIISQMLELRIASLNVCLHAMNSKAPINSKEWSAINDDLHWLIMIATWMLTQSNYGERELIPVEVIKLSIASNSDLSKTQDTVRRLEPNVYSDGVDPIVRIISIILNLCKTEQYIMENNMQLFSPQVSSTLSAFVSRFMSGYVITNEVDYKELSMTLVLTFGKDAPTTLETLNFVIGHILAKIFSLSAESELKEASSKSLVTFISSSPDRALTLLNSPLIEKLFSAHSAGSISQAHISPDTRKNIYHLFVLLCSQRNELWPQLFAPLQARYSKLQSAAAERNFSEQARSELIDLCDIMNGMLSGVSPGNIGKVWKEMVGLIFVQDSAKLLDAFHNYTEVVVALLELASVATNRALCFLDAQDTMLFYEATINLLNAYSRHNKGRASIEANSEEESCRDIELIMHILNDLAAKDFLDWFPSASNQANEQSTPVQAIQVVFLGLNIVMPLMSAQLLEFPKLSALYYKVITFLCEDPDRLKEVPSELLQSLMATVKHALTQPNFSSDIKCNCLSMLFMLAGHRVREPQAFSFINALLEPFLAVIFEFTLLECGSCKDVTLREHVANTLFCLICCYPETYQQLVQQLIRVNVEQRANNSGAEAAAQLDRDLRASFAGLMEGIEFSPEMMRQKRSQFKNRFELFINELQGLLRIK